MSGVRGIKTPLPMAGGTPTGMFSSKGSQKKDACTSAHKSLTGNKGDKARTKPVKRNNGLK